ncbi:MAG: (d)CMP kinase [Eubacteriaceae bacterium]
MKLLHIAIDGPAGAGKSTIAQILANELHIDYLDTGAMYRGLTYHILKNNISTDNNEAIIEEAKKINIDFYNKSIYLNNENIDVQIRSTIVSNSVSIISKIPEVRIIMVKKQQEIACNKSVIMDGRDIGTVVLPKASFKFYLDASIEIRAKRRFKQLQNKGVNGDIEKIKEDIAKRDHMDFNRTVSPLKKAVDAINIDTSKKTLREVVDMIANIINKNTENNGGEDVL